MPRSRQGIRAAGRGASCRQGDQFSLAAEIAARVSEEFFQVALLHLLSFLIQHCQFIDGPNPRKFKFEMQRDVSGSIRPRRFACGGIAGRTGPQAFAGPHSINHQGGNTMNKSELVEAVAKDADLSKADAEKALNAVIASVVKAVAKGDTVTLVGFGTFKPVKRAARTGRNPATGAALKIAASTSPKFTAGATFKAAVAGKKAAKKK